MTDEEFVTAELWKVAEAARREAAEEIAQACERDATYDVAARYHFARIARDTGKGHS